MQNPASERGSVIVIVLAAVIAVAAFSSAFMQNVGHDYRRTGSMERSLRAVYIAEAGVNHAILDVLAAGSGILGSSAAPVSFGGGGYWSTTVDHGDDSYTVTAFGRLGDQLKALEVVIAPEEIPLFTKALFGDLDLGATGTVFTDSYDSDSGSYASQAVLVDPDTGMLYAKANGSLGSNANIVINGTVTVLGDATPGPGGSVIIAGGTAFISGSTAPADSTNPLPDIDFSPTGPYLGNLSTTTDMTIRSPGTVANTA